jgi:hypothetical protein
MVWSTSARLTWIAQFPCFGASVTKINTKIPYESWYSRFRLLQDARDADFSASLEQLPDETRRQLARDRKTQLRAGLLKFGGWDVCQPAYIEDFDRIISRGVLLPGQRGRVIPGEPCACHRNVAQLWDTLRPLSGIMTGYALSPDGLWRQHSWLVVLGSRGPVVVETTTTRFVYFGFLLHEDEAYQFYNDNA